VSGSGISWAICKSTPRSRQITTTAPHHSVFTGWMPFLLPIQQHQSTEGTNDNNKWYEQQISVVGCLWYHRNQSWRLENTRWFLWKRFSCCWNLVIEPRHGSQWKQESLFQAAADVVIVRSLVRLYVPWLILYLNCLLTYLLSDCYNRISEASNKISYVCLSVCPFCICMGHDHSLPGKDNQGHRSGVGVRKMVM